MGLWKFCNLNNNNGEEICGDITDFYASQGANVPDFFKATRALTILGLILVAVAIEMVVLKIFLMNDKIFLSLGASTTAIAAGGLILIGTIVFGVKAVEESTADAVLGAGFGLGVVAGVIPIVAGIIFIIGRNK
ncbi:hypothetical protein ACJMK2_003818 [Sinanodonta woodiana]|uniref:Uncharacterized protein n=1 Tax=Sinanodonta woodiana TaxID=1069815 RepID=A0ABD3XZC0_SINWO